MLNTYLMAVLNSKTNTYCPVGKVAIGLKTEDRQQFNEIIENHKLSKLPDNYSVPPLMMPDVWIPVMELWTIKYKHLFKSPFYSFSDKDEVEIGLVASNTWFETRQSIGKDIDDQQFKQEITTQDKLFKYYLSEDLGEE